MSNCLILMMDGGCSTVLQQKPTVEENNEVKSETNVWLIAVAAPFLN
jgi:hypothetical protein